MYEELEDRSPAKMRSIVSVSFGSLFFVFAAFAVLGYLTFGPQVGDNILDALPHSHWGNAARVGAGFCIAGVYPIFLQSMMAPVWHLKSSGRCPLGIIAPVLTVAASGATAL